MSVMAVLAIGVLAAFTLASLCFVFRIPGAHDALKRLNWFRAFAHWTMFAANPNPHVRPGAFVIEYRDAVDGPWITALDGHHWAPHGILLSPHRFIAARAHHLGQGFAAIRGEPGMEAELRDRETLIATYLQRVHPLLAGQTRTIRIVKRFGSAAATESELAWQFTVRGQ